MPTYDYRCKECGNEQEVKLKLAELDTAAVKCYNCGGECERFMGAANHAFMSPETLGRKKAPSDFRNLLSAIKKAHDRPGRPCGIKDR